jgi:hypothetical protein
MMNKTKIALAALLIAGSAGVALANDSGENSFGGYVVPGSTDGVNPVYHPGWFPNYPRSTNPEGAKAYGYAPAKHHVQHKPTQDAR